MSGAADPFQLEVARIALAAAHRYGFALGGGHALIAHGLIGRPTQDVDLFTDVDGGVRSATGAVSAAFVSAGYLIEMADNDAGIDDLFDGFDDAFVEFDVAKGDRTVRMSLAQLDRRKAPVVLGVGPVMHMDDLIASKMCALGARAEIRDFIDIAAAIPRYPRKRLTELACTRDPGLGEDDFAAAMRRLDTVPDEIFRRYELTPTDIAELRRRFADWPRTTG